MKKIFTIILIGLATAVYAQSPLLWSEDYSVNLTNYYSYFSNSPQIIPENENSFKVVGKKNTTNGQRLAIVRYDISGTVLSEQIFGDDLAYNNQIIDYHIDNSNYLYILNSETININKSKIVFQKYSLDGDLIWVEQIQDSGIHSYEPWSLSVSENGTLFITAQKYVFDYDVYYDMSNRLYAYDSDGNQLWERVFDELTEFEWVSENNFVYNNEIYLFGKDLINTNQTFYFKLLKIDTDNNINLNTTVFLNNSFRHFYITQDNNLLVVAGWYKISKFDLNGTLLWSEYYQENPSFNPYLEEIKSSIQDENGNIYVTGRYWKYPNDNPNSTNNDILTLKFDSNGNLLWQNLYQYGELNADIGNTIALKNGYIYVGGQSQKNGIGTDYDYVVLKIDAETGNSNGVYRYDGSGEGTDTVTSLYVFDDGKVALTGLSYNGTDFGWTTQLLSDVILSVENISSENNIKVYPNPVRKNDMLTITGYDLKTYSVYTSVGQIVQQGGFDSGTIHNIKLNNLVSGMYILQLRTDNEVIIKRIIVN